MNHYEILYIIPSNYNEKDVETLNNKVDNLIEKEGGKITSKDNLGRRKLAYSINDTRQGFYLLNQFNFPAQKLDKLDKTLKLMPEVLRHLVTVAGQKSAKEIKRRKPIEKKVAEPVLKAPTMKDKKEEKVEKKEKKITMKELDKKLDQILEDDMMK